MEIIFKSDEKIFFINNDILSSMDINSNMDTSSITHLDTLLPIKKLKRTWLGSSEIKHYNVFFEFKWYIITKIDNSSEYVVHIMCGNYEDLLINKDTDIIKNNNMLNKYEIDSIIDKLDNKIEECVHPIGVYIDSTKRVKLAYYMDNVNIDFKSVWIENLEELSEYLTTSHIGCAFFKEEFSNINPINFIFKNGKKTKGYYVDCDNVNVLFYRKNVGFILRPMSWEYFEYDYTENNFGILDKI